jgi:hypothetical protein
MSLEPLLLSNINLSNIVYTEIKENNDKKLIFIKYKVNQEEARKTKFVFQLPTLTNNVSVNDKCELDFPIKCENVNKKNIIIDFFNKLDDQIINDCKNNPLWFKKKFLSYQKCLCEENILKLNLIKCNNFETTISINNEEKIEIYDIPKDGTCRIIVECYAIWINKNSFGLLLRPISISFKIDNLYNYKFLEDSICSENNNLLEDNDSVSDNNSFFIKQDNVKLDINDNLSDQDTSIIDV